MKTRVVLSRKGRRMSSCSRATRASRLLVTDPHAFWARARSIVGGGGPEPTPRGRVRRIDMQGVRFDVDLDLDPRMRKMARGTYEPEVSALLRRLLREGDVLIDVGANIGYLSAVGLGSVGRSGAVHAFEPVPRYLERLRSLAALNPSRHLRVNGLALGDEPGHAAIAVTSLANIGWNTMVPGFMAADHVAEIVEVPVTTLDAYVSEHDLHNVRVVTIDTEGFEFPVLRGFG